LVDKGRAEDVAYLGFRKPFDIVVSQKILTGKMMKSGLDKHTVGVD